MGLILSTGCTRRSPHFGLSNGQAVHCCFGEHHGEPAVVLLLNGVPLRNWVFVFDKLNVGDGTLSQLVCGIADCVIRRFSSFSRTSFGSSRAFASGVNSLDFFKRNSTIDAAHELSINSVSLDSFDRPQSSAVVYYGTTIGARVPPSTNLVSAWGSWVTIWNNFLAVVTSAKLASIGSLPFIFEDVNFRPLVASHLLDFDVDDG